MSFPFLIIMLACYWFSGGIPHCFPQFGPGLIQQVLLSFTVYSADQICLIVIYAYFVPGTILDH